jgi:uncharacterized membrane protein YedE/YeeE
MSIDLEHLKSLVLITTLLLAIGLGFALQRTQFCSMGAISDIFVMQSWLRMRQWLFALAVMLLGTSILYYGSWIDIHQTIYNSSKVLWLSHLVGGVLFGVGMSIASGCGARNLIRLGTGNIKSLVVLIVMGLFAQMTLRGIFGTIRVNSVDLVQIHLSTAQDLASILQAWVAIDTPLLFLIMASCIAVCLCFFSFKDPYFRRFQIWWISVVVGVSMVGFWWISGYLGFVPEDPNTLEPLFIATNSGKMESASLVAPMAYLLDYLTLFSDSSKRMSFGIILGIGLCLGSFLSAWQQGTLRLTGFGNATDLLHHLLGGALMGIGGVTALGCTFGQGLSAMSTLAISSFITVTGFVLGVYLGLRYLERSST